MSKKEKPAWKLELEKRALIGKPKILKEKGIHNEDWRCYCTGDGCVCGAPDDGRLCNKCRVETYNFFWVFLSDNPDKELILCEKCFNHYS